MNSIAQQKQTKSIASLVLGVISILCGFTLVVPLIGVVLGVAGRRDEPAGRVLASIGVVLNTLMLLGWVLIGIFVATGSFISFS